MDDGGDTTDDGIAYVPLSALPEPEIYTHLGSLVVDGETFAVRQRDADGSSHYDWVSGPNNGYGFSTSGSSEPLGHERHVTAIRGFLASIDPETGYL